MPDPTFPTRIPLETVAVLERVEQEAYVDLYEAAPAGFKIVYERPNLRLLPLPASAGRGSG